MLVCFTEEKALLEARCQKYCSLSKWHHFSLLQGLLIDRLIILCILFVPYFYMALAVIGHISGWHSPFPFGPTCFVVLVMIKEGESSWSGPWHLGCTLEVFHVHSYQDQFIQPGWTNVFFCIFSLGLCFVCSFVLFDLLVCCMSPLFYVSLGSWVISLTVFGTSITNLNEPLRALAASTIAWVRSLHPHPSSLHPFWAVVNKSNAG